MHNGRPNTAAAIDERFRDIDLGGTGTSRTTCACPTGAFYGLGNVHVRRLVSHWETWVNTDGRVRLASFGLFSMDLGLVVGCRQDVPGRTCVQGVRLPFLLSASVTRRRSVVYNLPLGMSDGW